MYNPQLYELQRTHEMISSFGGLDCGTVISDNRFNDELNMGGCEYPLLAPRRKRAFFNVCGPRLHGLFAKSRLIYINNGTLYYGGEAVEGLSLPDIDGERQLVSMGAKVIIFPDKLYLNTADLTDYGPLEACFETQEGTQVTCTLTRGDGTLYEDYVISSVEPEEAVNGKLWLDTSLTPNVLKQYSEALGMWVELEETYVRIACEGIDKSFEIYDGVELSGFECNELNGSFIIRDKGEGYLVVSAILNNTLTQSAPIKIERRLPQMDFVVESGNRLWGCSSKNNEIYASRLGDPTNFNSFMGVSTDSYTATVGSDGEFTGAIAFRGYLIFFKENCIHKIYGQNPPYTINTSYIRGVQKGSEKSLCIVNETLYYKSPNGICAFEGGVPINVSAPLGDAYYTNAVAGVLGNKYYVCMTNKHGRRVLFNYDESRNIWHKEDELDVRELANHNGNLYLIANIKGERRLCLADGEEIYGNLFGELRGWSPEEDFEWSCETGMWGLDTPENKYYSAITLRLYAEKGSRVNVDFQTDSNGVWSRQLTLRTDRTGSFTLPFISPRCDHIRIKISGRGKVKLFSISRKIEVGSELNVRP